MKDYGYDVADYCAVDPLFGTLADFDALLAEAHRLGLKVMMDFVPSHTSDQHPWFQESRQSRDNPKADWYVWADPRPDGTPPNNWLAVFGGSAWEWEPRRSQYYLHNFLKEQPDLNFHNPQVIEALLAQARFWLDRGVDGFRLDAIDFGVHDPKLRNNPPRRVRSAGGSAPGSPFAMQRQLWNKARPELIELFLKPLHALTERYAGKVAAGRDQRRRRAPARGRVHQRRRPRHRLQLRSAQLPRHARGHPGTIVAELEKIIGDGWGCWSFSNHDVRRAVTRWGGERPARGPAPAGAGAAGLPARHGLPLPGRGAGPGGGRCSAFEQLKDPFGIAFWPAFKGRDGCRTPLPWEAGAPQAGFTAGEPWLPIPESHRRRAVDLQERDAASVLNTTRAFLNWRRERQALRTGTITFLRAGGDVLAFERANAADRLLCLFNLGGDAADASAPASRPLDAGFASEGAGDRRAATSSCRPGATPSPISTRGTQRWPRSRCAG